MVFEWETSQLDWKCEPDLLELRCDPKASDCVSIWKKGRKMKPDNTKIGPHNNKTIESVKKLRLKDYKYRRNY